MDQVRPQDLRRGRTTNLFKVMKQIHIVPNQERDGWASKHFGAKQQAVDWSRNLAKKEGLEMIPHGKDGKIQNPNSYGNDPCPPHDKKH